jgi:hypothetical protein
MSNNHEKAVVERRGFRPNSLVILLDKMLRVLLVDDSDHKLGEQSFVAVATDYYVGAIELATNRVGKPVVEFVGR